MKVPRKECFCERLSKTSNEAHYIANTVGAELTCTKYSGNRSEARYAIEGNANMISNSVHSRHVKFQELRKLKHASYSWADGLLLQDAC